MSKAPIKLALEKQKKSEIEPAFRSGLEKKIAAQLDAAGIKYNYEGVRIPYAVPARVAHYLADFPEEDVRTGPDGSWEGIVIEGKGHFGATNYGARFSNMKNKSAEERKKFAMLKEQHPNLDIRFVFSRAAAPIYKGSPTTHAKWAEDHGFGWSEKEIPEAWIIEMQNKRKKQ